MAFYGLPTSERKYLAALGDKDALLRNATSPRLIVIGGSNLSFGLDSSLLEESLGYDVVNMGLHSGLGTRYMLAQVEPHLEAGDVVVLSFEYHLLNGGGTNQGLPESLAEFPGGLRYLRSSDHMELGTFLRAFQKRAQRFIGFIKEPDGPVYRRSGFDHNGDLITHLGELSREFGPTYKSFENPHSDAAMARIEAFHQAASHRGARVLLSFPPFPSEYVAPQGDVWLASLRQSLDVPIISDPASYFFPKRQFFDTCYHLSGEGRQRRSEQLLKDLRTAGIE